MSRAKGSSISLSVSRQELLLWMWDERKPVYRIMRMLLDDAERAHDEVSELALRVVRYAAKHPEAVVHPGWLYAAARNHALGVCRRDARRRYILREHAGDDLAQDEEENAEEQLLGAERRWRVQTMLAGLSEIEHRLANLRFVDGRSIAETCAELGLTPSATKMRASRLRQKLRRMWEGAVPAPPATLPAVSAI